MELERLTKEQIANVYNNHMKIDFPPSELKPLDMIYLAMDKGIYEFLGLVDNNEIHGYTSLMKLGEDYLIDYLAVYPEHRNKGLGAQIIRGLASKLKSANSIIGEVEDPRFANDAGEKDLQTRRLNFYLRNGFRDTSARVRCFGVNFIIIEMGEGLCHSVDEIKELYCAHYKAVLPEPMFKRNIRV